MNNTRLPIKDGSVYDLNPRYHNDDCNCDLCVDSGEDVCVPASPEFPPDSWEAISAQLDFWADMDREYWRQRKEKEYKLWLERTYPK